MPRRRRHPSRFDWRDLTLGQLLLPVLALLVLAFAAITSVIFLHHRGEHLVDRKCPMIASEHPPPPCPPRWVKDEPPARAAPER